MFSSISGLIDRLLFYLYVRLPIFELIRNGVLIKTSISRSDNTQKDTYIWYVSERSVTSGCLCLAAKTTLVFFDAVLNLKIYARKWV